MIDIENKLKDIADLLPLGLFSGKLGVCLCLFYKGNKEEASGLLKTVNELRMIGYGENLDSGFPFILSAWNEKHWLKPELIEQPELMQVKLILHIEDVADESKSEPKSGPKQLTKRQYRILQAISILDRSGGNTYGAWII